MSSPATNSAIWAFRPVNTSTHFRCYDSQSSPRQLDSWLESNENQTAYEDDFQSMNLTATMIVYTTLAFVLTPEPAQACSCAAPAGPAEGLKRSTAVFSGRVVEIDRPFFDRVGLTNSGSHRLKFQILRRWKGARSNTVEVVTRLSGEACGFPFEQAKEYLVYVFAEPRDLQTGICTGTKSIAEAAQEMIQLDELIGPTKK